jgi:hypothetical protein
MKRHAECSAAMAASAWLLTQALNPLILLFPTTTTPAPASSSFLQYNDSRKQAEKNKRVGRATNMKLALF